MAINVDAKNRAVASAAGEVMLALKASVGDPLASMNLALERVAKLEFLLSGNAEFVAENLRELARNLRRQTWDFSKLTSNLAEFVERATELAEQDYFDPRLRG